MIELFIHGLVWKKRNTINLITESQYLKLMLDIKSAPLYHDSNIERGVQECIDAAVLLNMYCHVQT